MKIKYAFAALALSSAFVMSSAFADTPPVQIINLTDSYGTGVLSSSFGGTHSLDTSFTDTFQFTPSSFTGIAGSLLSAFSLNSFSGLKLTSASLNGTNFTFDQGGPVSFLYNYNQFVTAPLTLTVTGMTFGQSGSYSGVIDVSGVSPTLPVPEPETYAMMLAGLGLLGFAARRKAKGNQA